uniref:Uncharacterized protein n=1 Tax=Heterorhabditis bacteriophora TaxID=37862 RepID=A0A1I7WY50_HETBA
MTDASIRSNVLRLCPLLINIYEKNDLDWKKQEALKCGILIKDLLDIEKQWTNVENIGLELHNRYMKYIDLWCIDYLLLIRLQ